MLFTRGIPDDYDRFGFEDWSFEKVLPYFKKFEDNLDIDKLNQSYHGVGGPVSVSFPKFEPPMNNDLLQGYNELSK